MMKRGTKTIPIVVALIGICIFAPIVGAVTATEWNNNGVSFIKTSKYEKAIECFDKAIELDPNSAIAYNNRGNAYYYLKQYEGAIKDYNKAIEQDPNYANTYYSRGRAYYNLKQYERAIEDYTRAIVLDPNYATDANAYHNRGWAYYNLKQYEIAIEDYNKAIALNQNFAVAYNNRGFAYYYLSQYEIAIADYDKAIELNPNLAEAYNNRGVAYKNLGQYERAIEDYDKAIELDPNYAVAYDNREIALRKLKQEQMATQTPTPISVSPLLPISPEYLYVIPIALFLILLSLMSYIREKRKKTATTPEMPLSSPERKEQEQISTPISESVTIERAIYDPCKRDFIESALPRMKEWINRYDPSAYWFAISIQYNTDRAIEEWDVDLEFSSALKIEEATIEGIEYEIPHEAHLNTFKISVPKEYGIVIPKGGAQRVYFKLRAEKPKTTYEISGVFKSAITGDVPIRAKEFKYLCDTGVSPEAVKAELKKTFSEKDAARLALSFKTVQEIDRMCNQDAKTEEYLDKLLVLRNYTGGFSDKFEKQVDEFSRFMEQEQLGYLDDKYKGKVRRFCTNLVDVWISEFLKG